MSIYTRSTHQNTKSIFKKSVSTYLLYQSMLFVCLSCFINTAHSIAPPNPDLNPFPDVPQTTGSCPDYAGAIGLAEFNWPEQQSFQSVTNRYWSQFYSPYHMVHDVIVNPNQEITVVAKFDYGRVFHKDLENEYVRAYIYGTGLSQWQYLGRFKTDSDGKISVNVDSKATPGEYIVRMVVEGDLSSADGFVSVAPEGQDTVLFDIDGTLTLADFEQVGDYLGVSVAQSWPFAKEVVQAYIDKGYRVVFLTSRPYWIARDTREWFTNEINLPQWHLHTDDFGDGPFNLEAEDYKREYLNFLQDEVNLNIVRAYGNASTDISAYADSGIRKEDTWIIGSNAGNSGTQAIEGDYENHLTTVVESTPESFCRL